MYIAKINENEVLRITICT